MQLKKELGFLDVFSIATGTMVSSGLFILPAVAYAEAGPAMILSYIFASILVIPSILSQAELATAMPRAGGMYFYIERSLGSMLGLFSGLADWFSVALKSAFAVLGIGIVVKYLVARYLGSMMTEQHLKEISVIFCLFLIAQNLVSVRHTGRFHVLFVAGLLAILGIFVVFGAQTIEPARYEGFLSKGWPAVFTTTGLVFISFGGLNKVLNIAEEVHNPSKNLPLGVFFAWFVVVLFYIAVMSVTVGVLSTEELTGSLMPFSLAASKFMAGGFLLLSAAAMVAFITTGSAGILSASRTPMAMSRDQLLSPALARVSKRFKTPHYGVLLTGGFMIVAIIFLDVEMLAKTASTLLIILYILTNASVIVMRESRIQSYRPKFKSPLYPYLHIITIIIYAVLIIDMGRVPLLTAAGFVCMSALWYFIYVSKRVKRASAVMHIVERVTDVSLRTVTLEDELRDILIERDNIIEDRFDRLIRECEFLDIKGRQSDETVFRQVSEILEQRLAINRQILFDKFIKREKQGGTVVHPGFAIPHIVVEGREKFDILLVRAVDGIDFPQEELIKIMFILVGSKDERNYHLRALMAIAQIAQDKNFEKRWLTARDATAIRNILFLSARKRDASSQI